MKKLYFGLVVAGATLASVSASVPPASAVIFNYGGTSYDVTTKTGTFYSLSNEFITAPTNSLWGNPTLSEGLAREVRGAFGLNLYGEGPYFSYEYTPHVPGTGMFDYNNSYVAFEIGSFPYYVVYSAQVAPNWQVTYAKATPVPEPLTILGSVTGTGFVAIFNRIKNKKKNS
jgi:hypothetical protein